MDNKQKLFANLVQNIYKAKTETNIPSRMKGSNLDSETIVSYIIDKVISLALTEALRNEIDGNIPQKCFSYLTNMINTYIKVEYLPYDRDDRYIFNQSHKQKIIKHFLNSNSKLNNNLDKNHINNNNYVENDSKNNKNTQSNLSNKSCSIIDINSLEEDSSMEERENNKILNKELIENEFLGTNDNNNHSNYNIDENFGYFFDNKFFGVNDWSICEEPASAKIDRSATSMLKMIKPPPKEKDDDNHSIKTSEIMSKSKYKFRSVKNTIKIDAEHADKNHHHPAHKEEMHHYKLSNIEEFAEDTLIRDVRLEKEKQLKKEEEEKKMKRIQEKEINEKNLEMMKKLKENQNKHFTTDVQGNILLIKGTGMDRQQGEFFFPKLSVLERNTITPNNIGNNVYQRTGDKKDQPASRIPSSKSKLLQKLPIKGNAENSTIINSNLGNFSNLVQVYTNNTINSQLNNKDINTISVTDKDKASILPAGSSFDLLAPEVGVTIIEGEKIKTGGKDFFKQFKKYSKYEYNQYVRDNMNTDASNQSSINKLQSLARNGLMADTVNKFLDYKTLKMNNTVSNFGFTKENSEEGSYEMEGFRDNSLKSGIKLNTKYGTSLRTAMEKLDLIPEFEESEIDGGERKMNNIDLFKNPEINNYKKIKNEKKISVERAQTEELAEMNKFANSIMKTKNWGASARPSTTEESSKNYNFHKPDKKEIEREIGKNIYNIKLPRARLPTKIKEPAINSFNKIANNTTTAAFALKFFPESTLNKNNTAFNNTTYNDKKLLNMKK